MDKMYVRYVRGRSTVAAASAAVLCCLSRLSSYLVEGDFLLSVRQN